MGVYPSPFRYPGGKSKLFQFMQQLLLDNGKKYDYVEPFAGGGGLALRLLFSGCVRRIWLNDFDRAIFAFWTSILEHTDEFCAWITQVSLDVDTWLHYRECYEEKSIDLLELGKAAFYLNRTNVSGILKGGIIGGLAQCGRYKMGVRFNRTKLVKKIRRIAERKAFIDCTCLDGVTLLHSVPDTYFMYLDPPYIKKGNKLYMNTFTKEDHMYLSKELHHAQLPWVLSYDYHSDVVDWYSSFSKGVYSVTNSTSRKTGKELIVFSKGVVHTAACQYLFNYKQL